MSAASEIRWRHSRSPAFKKAFDALPARVQERARAVFRTLATNPEKTDLHPLIWDRSIYRISIGDYRAVATKQGNHFRWTFIGSHESYNRIAKNC